MPDADALPALSVQLAAYRLAWAALVGEPIENVRAAFHYVRHDHTLRPADLLDARRPEGPDPVSGVVIGRVRPDGLLLAGACDALSTRS